MAKLNETQVNKAYGKLETAMLALQEEVVDFKRAFPIESSKLALDDAMRSAMGALEDVDSDITSHFATR
jgi:hypothetical protein